MTWQMEDGSQEHDDTEEVGQHRHSHCHVLSSSQKCSAPIKGLPTSRSEDISRYCHVSFLIPFDIHPPSSLLTSSDTHPAHHTTASDTQPAPWNCRPDFQAWSSMHRSRWVWRMSSWIPIRCCCRTRYCRLGYRGWSSFRSRCWRRRKCCPSCCLRKRWCRRDCRAWSSCRSRLARWWWSRLSLARSL